jgi:hypothetical protein
MAAKQPLSFKTITDAIDQVEASVQAASVGAEDAADKDNALRFLEQLRGSITTYCASQGLKSGPQGPEFIPFRGV